MCPSTLFYKMEASEKVEAQAKSDLLVFCRWSTLKVVLYFWLTNFTKSLPTRLHLEGGNCPFSIRIAANCVKKLYLEQTFECFAPFFVNETKQSFASHTKCGGAMGFKFNIKSTYKTKSQ